MVFLGVRRGGCGEAVVINLVELAISTPSSCSWGDLPSYLGATASKTAVGPTSRFGVVEITLHFSFFKLHITLVVKLLVHSFQRL